MAIVPMPPSTSIMQSPRVAPVIADDSYSRSFAPATEPTSCLRIAARSWNVIARRFGPPTRRACSSIPAMSMPAVDTRATSDPSAALRTTLPSSSGVTHWSWT